MGRNKSSLRGKFIVINTYAKKQKSQINDLTLYLKEFEKKEVKPKVSRMKEITKIRAELNAIKPIKAIEKLN